jgi:DNA-binding CsgD family transcriptional regulator
MLMVDTVDVTTAARIARAANDDELARVAATAADEMRRVNPGVASIAGAAAQTRGLLERDCAAHAEAVHAFEATPRALSHASALEDYGVELVRSGERDRGVETLGHALKQYSTCNAAWDASRVRRRLRELGVRRRIVKAVRPATGWPGLTDAEVSVVRLVAQGLTNREVAEQLYVSPHTVSMHLRHVFTKLDIKSRVELTRLAFEHGKAA